MRFLPIGIFLLVRYVCAGEHSTLPGVKMLKKLGSRQTNVINDFVRTRIQQGLASTMANDNPKFTRSFELPKMRMDGLPGAALLNLRNLAADVRVAYTNRLEISVPNPPTVETTHNEFTEALLQMVDDFLVTAVRDPAVAETDVLWQLSNGREAVLGLRMSEVLSCSMVIETGKIAQPKSSDPYGNVTFQKIGNAITNVIVGKLVIFEYDEDSRIRTVKESKQWVPLAMGGVPPYSKETYDLSNPGDQNTSIATALIKLQSVRQSSTIVSCSASQITRGKGRWDFCVLLGDVEKNKQSNTISEQSTSTLVQSMAACLDEYPEGTFVFYSRATVTAAAKHQKSYGRTTVGVACTKDGWTDEVQVEGETAKLMSICLARQN